MSVFVSVSVFIDIVITAWTTRIGARIYRTAATGPATTRTEKTGIERLGRGVTRMEETRTRPADSAMGRLGQRVAAPPG